MTHNVHTNHNYRRARALELVDAATAWLSKNHPDLDFSVHIDNEGSGVTLSRPDRAQHLSDVLHPTPVSTSIFRAASAVPASGEDFNVMRGGARTGDLQTSLTSMFHSLPDHIVWFGREGDTVFSEVMHTERLERAKVVLDVERFTLADAVLAAAQSRMADLDFSASEARQAA